MTHNNPDTKVSNPAPCCHLLSGHLGLCGNLSLRSEIGLDL